MRGKRANKKFVTLWELWIKKPPLKAISLDKGKTWEISDLECFPWNLYKDDVSFLCYRKSVRKERI